MLDLDNSLNSLRLTNQLLNLGYLGDDLKEKASSLPCITTETSALPKLYAAPFPYR